ncbi:MAG: sulfotransferase, partial [Planctomycetaceae bacterium]|nr:sulfotransferase [Planctomycetaceae bacterium]
MACANVLLVAGSANFSTRDVWDGYRLGLESQDVRVVPYPTFSFLKVLSADAVCNDIIGTAVDVANGFDTVIFVDGLYFRGERARVPQSIRRAGIPTVLITTDDPYETIPNVESLYTYRFTNEIRSAVDGAVYLPTATLPLPEPPHVEQPRYDVSFLGTVFEDRLPLLMEVAQFCEQEGLRFLIAGKVLAGKEPFERFACTDVRQRTIDTLEKWEIYSQSRVTLNLFRQSEHAADSPSPRVFEVTAFGQAALVTGPRRSQVTRIWGDSVYHFGGPASCLDAIRSALADDAERRDRVTRARRITINEHLYEHRAASLIAQLRDDERQRLTRGVPEERVAWIIGSGRTGSTWLAEMLGDLPLFRRWHEPYFGRFVKYLEERPEELDRPSSFFARRHQRVWVEGLRTMFFDMVQDRYPQFGRHALAVKEVNTPELYRWLGTLFPTSKIVWLVRDPYDVLDSYLDLQKPGSWNQRFGNSEAPLSPANVRRTAEHIRSCTLDGLEAYEAAAPECRLRISYEELLSDPVRSLQACGDLTGVPVDTADAEAAVEAHRFSRH